VEHQTSHSLPSSFSFSSYKPVAGRGWKIGPKELHWTLEYVKTALSLARVSRPTWRGTDAGAHSPHCEKYGPMVKGGHEASAVTASVEGSYSVCVGTPCASPARVTPIPRAILTCSGKGPIPCPSLKQLLMAICCDCITAQLPSGSSPQSFVPACWALSWSGFPEG
jgi:hypothetical protein